MLNVSSWFAKKRGEEPEQESMEFYPIVDKYFGGDESKFREHLAAFYECRRAQPWLTHLDWELLVEMHHDEEAYQQKRLMDVVKKDLIERGKWPIK